MRIGMGWLGWTPDVFWAATHCELLAAMDGKSEMLIAQAGGDPRKARKKETPDTWHKDGARAWLNDLFRRVGQELH